MEATDYPEISVTSYQSALRNIPEQGGPNNRLLLHKIK